MVEVLAIKMGQQPLLADLFTEQGRAQHHTYGAMKQMRDEVQAIIDTRTKEPPNGIVRRGGSAPDAEADRGTAAG